MLVMVMVAPGTTAPVESATVPVSVPVGPDCARTRKIGVARVIIISHTTRLLALLKLTGFIDSFLLEDCSQ
jgi:hypothetical protein